MTFMPEGITAASTATAALAITQAATQKNANEATATRATVLQMKALCRKPM